MFGISDAELLDGALDRLVSIGRIDAPISSAGVLRIRLMRHRNNFSLGAASLDEDRDI
jgi:hypothetical protein